MDVTTMRLLRLALPIALLVTLVPGQASAAETSLIEAGATWRYDDANAEQATSWQALDFDDSSWSTGPAQLGFGDGDESTLMTPGAMTYYLRKSFTVDDAAAVGTLELSTLVDDAAAVYINGEEVWRSENLPANRDFTTRATSYVAGKAEEVWKQAQISASSLVSGTNVVAVEVHQHARDSSDVSFDLSLRASTEAIAPPKDTTPRVMCTITDSRIRELSGLVASVRFPDILWANNDSGDVNRVFAIDANTCAVRAVVTMAGAGYNDYESISMGRDTDGEPVIWVGDTGDNGRSRSNVKLYRFEEPTKLADQTVDVKAVTITWSDGKRDCESLFVEPIPGGRVFLVSKESTSGIYELQGNFRETGTATTGTRIGTTLGTATDAAVAPDMSRTIVRNYSTKASLLTGVPGTDPQVFAIPAEQQGEAITFSADSQFVYVGSEGLGQPLYRIPL
jgi:hypothetical protein